MANLVDFIIDHSLAIWSWSILFLLDQTGLEDWKRGKVPAGRPVRSCFRNDGRRATLGSCARTPF
jgi:hypothetical protein